MRESKSLDYFLLTILAFIWASAFFNIKIATYSYGPLTIAFLRIFFGAIPVVLLCFFKRLVLVCDYWNYKFSNTFFFNSLRGSKSTK